MFSNLLVSYQTLFVPFVPDDTIYRRCKNYFEKYINIRTLLKHNKVVIRNMLIKNKDLQRKNKVLQKELNKLEEQLLKIECNKDLYVYYNNVDEHKYEYQCNMLNEDEDDDEQYEIC